MNTNSKSCRLFISNNTPNEKSISMAANDARYLNEPISDNIDMRQNKIINCSQGSRRE